MRDIDRARRQTIADMFSKTVRKNKDKIALIFNDQRYTYQALEHLAVSVAGKLYDAGLQRGDRIAVYGKNSDHYVIIWLASIYGGFVHVPINFALTGESLLYIIRQSGAKACFYDQDLIDHIRAIEPLYGLSIIETLNNFIDSVNTLDTETVWKTAFDDIKEHDLVQLLYTSGTTAHPKGAMMTHGAFIAEYLSVLYDLDFTRDDRMLHALPLYHSAQMHVFLMPQLLIGTTNYLIASPKAEMIFKYIQEHEITSMFAPPTVWINLLRHPSINDFDLTSLKKIYYGASIMPVPVLLELRQRFPGVRFYNAYGQSEMAPLATVLRPEDHETRPASAGRPVLQVETRVVDADMRDVPPGILGEIVHRSPQLMIGYWDKPEETQEAFKGGWFHSGDLGYFDEEGYLYVVDRIKDVINTGGVLVASREVEEVLYKHPSVSEVAVIALPDETWIEAVTAIVVLKKGMHADEEALKHFCRDHLASYKVPKHFIFVEDLPRNASGKILKRELRDKYKISRDTI